MRSHRSGPFVARSPLRLPKAGYSQAPLTSPRRLPCTLHPQLPASLPCPPLLPLSFALSVASAFVFRAPLVSRALSLWLGARIRVASVGYAPLRGGLWTFGETSIADRRGRPLASFAGASVSSAVRPVLVDTERSASSHADGASRGDAKNSSRAATHREKFYVVKLDRPEVAACFDSFDLATSNWSEWATQFRRRANDARSDGGGASGPRRGGDARGAATTATSPVAPRVQLDIKGGLRLSLRYSGPLAPTSHIITDVLLTSLDGVGDDLLSAESAARLVERLSARALRSAKSSSVRFANGEVRTAARRFARRTLQEETRGVRAVARARVRKLRRGIEKGGEEIGRLPDAEGIRDAARIGGSVLREVERWLGMVERGSGERQSDSDTDSEDDREDYARGQRETGSQGSGSGHVGQPAVTGREGREAESETSETTLAPSPPPAPKYLELDEEWAGSSTRSSSPSQSLEDRSRRD